MLEDKRRWLEGGKRGKLGDANLLEKRKRANKRLREVLTMVRYYMKVSICFGMNFSCTSYICIVHYHIVYLL